MQEANPTSQYPPRLEIKVWGGYNTQSPTKTCFIDRKLSARRFNKLVLRTLPTEKAQLSLIYELMHLKNWLVKYMIFFWISIFADR